MSGFHLGSVCSRWALASPYENVSGGCTKTQSTSGSSGRAGSGTGAGLEDLDRLSVGLVAAKVALRGASGRGRLRGWGADEGGGGAVAGRRVAVVQVRRAERRVAILNPAMCLPLSVERSVARR